MTITDSRGTPLPSPRPRRRGGPRPDRLAAAEFKATCLDVMDTVQRERWSVTITKHGRPVARLVPVDEVVPSPIGALAGSVVRSDLVEPDVKAWRGGSDPLDQPARG